MSSDKKSPPEASSSASLNTLAPSDPCPAPAQPPAPISDPPPTILPMSLTSPDQDPETPTQARIPRSLTLRLYTSHFLSTWNSRLFEFGAVLFLASAFPGTLLPMSVYALVRSGAAILFAQAVGAWIDGGERLVVARASILGQRIAVAVSCGVFWVLEERKEKEMGEDGLRGRGTAGLFAVVVLAACVEKACSVMNLVAVERDWVVVITQDNEEDRRYLNAKMRRIDLLCKLLGPLAISTIAISSTLIAIWATLAMNLVAVLFEYICIEQVYKMVPALRREPRTQPDNTSQEANPDTHPNRRTCSLQTLTTTLLPISSLPFYFSHPAFLPSFSLSLLYLTVLSFSGQMITYLLAVGYTTLHVGLARAASTIFELSATWIAPRVMARVGIVRGGIWSLSWQMVWLAAAVAWFFRSGSGGEAGTGTNSTFAATGLVVGVVLSRVGLWGYDLCAQNIVQDEVEVDYRGTFSTVEAAFQNLFELVSYVTTIVFSRPDQFQWPVVISVVAVYVAGGLYTYFVRKRRGHLFHPPPCVSCTKREGV